MQPPTPSHATTLAGKTDDWFQRARAALLNQVPCRAGCARCCIGIFPITRLDARLLREGLQQLPEDQRTVIRDRARQQSAALRAAEPRLRSSPAVDAWPDTDIDRVIDAFDDARCPALSDDGLCQVYAHRPLACRTMGIPARDAGVVNPACEIQVSVPVVRIPASLEAEEEALAGREAAELALLPEVAEQGEEILLPFGFVDCEDRRTLCGDLFRAEPGKER